MANNVLDMSKKKFLEQAKVLKRRHHISAAEARDQLALKYGYIDFSELEANMVSEGKWRK